MKKISLIFLILFASNFLFAALGDNCSTAILVSSNGCSTASQYSNTGIAGTISPTCFGAGTNNSMWFSFVATAPTVNITVNGSSLTQPMIALFGTPTTAPCTGTFPELTCDNPATGSVSTVNYNSLTVGSIYYIVVDGKNSLSGTFQLCITSYSPPVNDDPCNALILPTNNFCSPVDAYTNVGALGENLTSTLLPTCFDSPGTKNTVFFKFTAVASASTIIINGSSTGLNRPQAAVLSLNGSICSGTSFVAVNCLQSGVGVNSITLNYNSLVIGNTYYIIVDGYSSNTGAFQICLNNYVLPPSTVINDECVNATNLCPYNQYFATTKDATVNISTDPAGTANGAGGVSDWGSINSLIDNDVWFTFTTTNPVTQIDFVINGTCDVVSPSTTWPDGGGLQFAVFKRSDGLSSCSPITPGVSWIKKGGVNAYPMGSTYTLSIPTTSLLPNTQYYVVVDNYPGDGCDFNFTIKGNQGTYAGIDDRKCLTDTPFNLTGFLPGGGTWSGAGITNAALGTFSPSIAGIGTHTLYYTQGSCTDSKTITVTAPTVIVSNDVSICSGASTTLSGSVSGVTSQVLNFTNTTDTDIPFDGVLSSWTGGGLSASSLITPVGLNTGFKLNSVTLNIVYGFSEDLIVRLTNSCGNSIQLVKQNGTLDDENFIETNFSSTATSSISTGSGSFTGSFIPVDGAGAWATFLSCGTTTGSWKLEVGNTADASVFIYSLLPGLSKIGTLLDWTLNFTNPIAPPTYAWTSSPVTAISNSTSSLSQTVSPAATTAYTLTSTDFYGCTNSDLVNVTVVVPPVLSLHNPTAVCSPLTVDLTAPAVTAGSTGGGVLSYWNDLACTSSLTTASAITTSGTYYIKSTVGNCTDVKSVIVTINPSPSLTVTNPAAVCSPSTVDITAAAVTIGSTGGGVLSYWVDALATATSLGTANAVTTSGTYYIKSTLGSCTDIKPVVVTINPKPSLTITNPAVVCSPLTVDITAAAVTAGSTGGGVLSYWVDALATATSLGTANAVTTSGTYYIKSTLGSCTDIKPVVVTINPSPSLTITNPAAVCSPSTVDITAPAVTAGSIGGGVLSYWVDALATATALGTANAVTTSGTYYIKSTLGSCTDVKPVVVTNNPKPSLTITNPAAVCSPLTVDITTAAVTAGSTGGGALSYWVDALATATSLGTANAVTFSGTYFIKSTLGSCTDIKPVVVTINPKPSLTITNPTAVCSPLTVDITAGAVTAGSTGGGALSYWVDALATATSLGTANAVTTSGTYYIKSTLGSCTDIKPVIVTINPKPSLTITNPGAVCLPLKIDLTDPSVTAGSTGGGVLSYWTNIGCTTPLASPTMVASSGTYYIKTTTVIGSCTDSKPVSININDCSCPVVLNTTNPSDVCFPQTIDLTATPSIYTSSSTAGPVTITYWTDATASTAVNTPSAISASGVYYIKSDDGGCNVIKPVTVTINSSPSLNITNPPAVCSSNTVDITASNVTTGSTGAGTLSYWSDAMCSSSILNPTTISIGNTYYIKSTTTVGACTDIKPVVVTINATPVLVITNPTNACPPLTVDITSPSVTAGSTGGGTLSYFTDITCLTPLVSPTSVSISGTYYIKSTNVTCTDSKAVTVSISAPVLAITNPTAVCSPNSVDITSPSITVGSTGNGILTYWTDAGCTASLLNPGAVSIGTTYYIKSTGGNCSDIKPVVVTINTKPLLTITSPNAVCSPFKVDITGASVTLGSTGAGALSYWTDNLASSSLVTPTAIGISGTYYIKSLLGNCFDIQPVIVTINSTPSLTITDPLGVCTPSTVNLTSIGITAGSTGGGTLSYWSDNTASTPLITPSAVATNGTYYIKSLLGNCFDIKPVNVSVTTTPSLHITDPLTKCTPFTVDITSPSVTAGSTGGGVLTYWTNLSATTSLLNTTAISTAGIYFIKAENGVCSDIKQVTVTISPTPSILVTDPLPVCSPLTVNITNSAEVKIASGPIPAPTFWTDNTATTPIINPSTISVSGTYYIKAANGSCIDIKPVNVVINTKPSLTISNPTAICSPLTVDLTAAGVTVGSTGGGILSYWSDALGTIPLGNAPAISSSGLYYIKSTTAIGGCTDLKSVNVIVNTTPTLMITHPLAVCSPSTVDITKPSVTIGSTGNGVLSYYSDPLATIPLANSTTIPSSGVFYIKSTATGNCTAISSVNVTVNTSPVLVVTDPDEVCEPTTIDLTDPKVIFGSAIGAGIQIGYYSNPSCTSALISPTKIRSSGTYYVKSSQNNCPIVMPVQIKINPKPKANFIPTPAVVSTINSISKMVNTSENAISYSWTFNDGAESGEISPEHTFPDKEQSSQVVVLIATSDKGCVDSISKLIQVNEELIYYVPNTFTPDDNDFNQVFKPIFTSGYEPTSYTLLIFDRWGEIVFESHDVDHGWNGRYGKNENQVIESVYTWKINFKIKGLDKHQEVTGHINLIR